MEGLTFAQRNVRWVERALERLAARPTLPKQWLIGTPVYFRGDEVKIESAEELGWIRLGNELIQAGDTSGDLRRVIERHIGQIARRELPPRVFEYAVRHELRVRRVTIRNQRSRWGSCSSFGTISLNWRLLQTPLYVQDYLILHELMHLREMNHSARFWREVETVCPEYELAERWLKEHSGLLK